MNDETKDPKEWTEEKLRESLSRAYCEAMKWSLMARRLFFVGAAGTVVGLALIIAGALKLVGQCAA